MLSKTISAATLALSTAGMAHAVSLTPNEDAGALATATLATSGGLTIVDGSASLVGDPQQQGTYSDFTLSAPGLPTLSIDDGAILTTAELDFSLSESTTNSGFGSSSTGAYQPLVDLAEANGLSTVQTGSNVLSFDFTVDDTTADGVSTNFIFGTEEYPTQSVTDIVGIFVNGVNYAFFPNGDLVSNQGGDPNDFFASGYPIEINGFTDVFTLEAPVVAGVNTIAFAVSNTSDTLYDSVLLFGDLKSIGEVSGGGGIVTPAPVVPLPAGGLLLLSALGLFGLRRRKG